MGKLFGHKFRPRHDTKTDYPPNTVEGLSETLRVLLERWGMDVCDSISDTCEGYRCMDISTETYVHDVCERCGLVVKRPERPAPEEPKRSVTVAQPTPASAPVAPAPAPAPKVVVVPVGANQAATVQTVRQPNPVKAMPGRGPK